MKAIKTILVLLASGFLYVSCGNDQAQSGSGGALGAPSYPVVTLPIQTVSSYTTYPTSIDGMVNSEVRAKIAGYIVDVLVDEGEKVQKGQTLFRLETQSLDQDAAAAKANVYAAQVEVDKLNPLVEKNIISKVQLETANAKLQLAKSNYNGIKANIDYGNIKSPIDGYVGSLRLRKGSLVSPNNQDPLTIVSDISSVYAYFSMNEKEYLDFVANAEGIDIAAKIKNLPKVSLVLANGSLYEEEGSIETINSQINSSTGSISFRAVFKNPSRILTNGNSGQVRIPKVYPEALVVPKATTYELQGSIYVYKVDADSTVVASPIGIKAEVGNLYVVASGIQEGDRIIARGIGKIKEAMKVSPMTIPFDSIAMPIEKSFR